MHDADGSVIQSLSLNILGDNKSALSSIDETITALVALQATAVRMRDGVDVIKDLADSLQKLSKVKIPNSVPEQLQKIDAALKGTYGKGASGMKNVADAMQDITETANNLPVAESFDKAKNTAGGLSTAIGGVNFVLVETGKSLLTIEQVVEHATNVMGLLGREAKTSASMVGVLTDNLKNAGYIFSLPSGKKEGLLGLPEKSSAQAMKILKETSVEMDGVRNAASITSEQEIINVSNLKDANAELDKISVKLAELSRGNNRININADTPLYGGITSQMMPISAKASPSRAYTSPIGPAYDVMNGYRLSGEVDALTTKISKLGVVAQITKKHLMSFKVLDAGLDLKAFGSSIGQVGEKFKDLKNKLIGASSGFGKLLKSIKRIATYRAIRAALKAITSGIKEGISNLYKWSDAFDSTREFANSMDRIATALLYVKNSLGAMIAPIVNAVAPAIDYLADKFVSLINVVNHFIAAITGAATYTVAKKIATQYQEIGDSASGAAKAMKSFTIGIDELNIIEDTAGGRGGAGTPGDVAADWFEKREVSNDMRGFASKVKNLAEEVAGYFTWAFNDAQTAFENFIDFIENPDIEILKGWGKESWENMILGFQTIGEWIGKAWNKLRELREETKKWSGILDDFISSNLMQNSIGEWIIKAIDFANTISDVKETFDNIKDDLKQIWNFIQKIVNRATGHGSSDWGVTKSAITQVINAGFGHDLAQMMYDSTEAELKTMSPYFGLMGLAYLVTPMKNAINNQGKTMVAAAARQLGISAMTAVKDGASANANSVYTKIGSIGSQMVSTFKNNASYSSFKSAGENIVNGIIAGLDSKKGQVYNSISVLASKTGSKFNYTLKIQSPSRVFMESGKYIDEGLALGIDRNSYKVEDSVAKLSNTFTNFAPAIDTSKLSIPDAQALYGDVQGAITADSKVSVQRADESLQNFIMETLMPVVTRIADDTKRQADKSEVIEIDGRKLNDSLNRQSRNNGYSFT